MGAIQVSCSYSHVWSRSGSYIDSSNAIFDLDVVVVEFQVVTITSDLSPAVLLIRPSSLLFLLDLRWSLDLLSLSTCASW